MSVSIHTYQAIQINLMQLGYIKHVNSENGNVSFYSCFQREACHVSLPIIVKDFAFFIKPSFMYSR